MPDPVMPEAAVPEAVIAEQGLPGEVTPLQAAASNRLREPPHTG